MRRDSMQRGAALCHVKRRGASRRNAACGGATQLGVTCRCTIPYNLIRCHAALPETTPLLFRPALRSWDIILLHPVLSGPYPVLPYPVLSYYVLSYPIPC